MIIPKFMTAALAFEPQVFSRKFISQFNFTAALQMGYLGKIKLFDVQPVSFAHWTFEVNFPLLVQRSRLLSTDGNPLGLVGI